MSELENVSVASDDCSTLSVGSPRYDSPSDGKDGTRTRNSFRSGSLEKGKYGSSSRRTSLRDSRDNIEEQKQSSTFYSLDAKEGLTQSPEAKDIHTHAHTHIHTNLHTESDDSKPVSDSGDRVGDYKAADPLTPPSLQVRRKSNSNSLDIIRNSAALMTAGGSGLNSRIIIEDSPYKDKDANSSVSGRDHIGTTQAERDLLTTLTRDLTNVMDISKNNTEVYLYVAPAPSPMAQVSSSSFVPHGMNPGPVPVSVSKFSSRLQAHQISADPFREAER